MADRTVDATAMDGCAELEIGARRIGVAESPASLDLSAEWLRRGVPTLSLHLDECRLERLRNSPLDGERKREEIGWATWAEAGELRFASAVGIRIHGQANEKGVWDRGFRLYFRSRLGAAGIPAEFVDDRLGRPVARLGVRRDYLTGRGGIPWLLVSQTVYEIGRELGGEAPYGRSAWLLLNGEPQGIFELVEHVGDDLLRRRFGHRRFDRLAAKGDSSPREAALQEAELDWVASRVGRMRWEDAAERFDLDQLTAWLVTDLVAATGDSFQAFLVRDRDGVESGGRWFPVHWDADVSFRLYPLNSTWRRLQDPLPHLLEAGASDRLLIGELLHRLLADDPAYRLRVATEVTRALNHRLTPAFFATLVERLAARVAELQFDDRRFLDELAAFLERRPAELLDQLHLLGFGPVRSVEVTGAENSLLIDGQPAVTPYRGRYPAGVGVEVEVQPACRDRFLGWQVDGERLAGSPYRLELKVEDGVRIEALFSAADPI